MDLDMIVKVGQGLTFAALVGWPAIHATRKILHRNQSHLESILPRKERRRIEKHFADQYGVERKHVKLVTTTVHQGPTTSTNRKGGYVATVEVRVREDGLWKVRKELVHKNIPKKIPTRWSGVNVGTFVQEYFTDVAFVPEMLTTDPSIGSLSPKKYDTTLSSISTDAPEEQRAALFVDLVDKVDEINIRSTHAFKNSVKDLRDKLGGNDRFRGRFGDDVLKYFDRVIREGDFCHGDLQGSNLLLKDRGAREIAQIVDWDNAHIGDAYQELLFAQRALGLEENDQSNARMTRFFSARDIDKEEREYSHNTAAFGYLKWASKISSYERVLELEGESTREARNLRLSCIASAIDELNEVGAREVIDDIKQRSIAQGLGDFERVDVLKNFGYESAIREYIFSPLQTDQGTNMKSERANRDRAWSSRSYDRIVTRLLPASAFAFLSIYLSEIYTPVEHGLTGLVYLAVATSFAAEAWYDKREEELINSEIAKVTS